MIRVLISEDEPPTARRLKRLIETTDPDFSVVAMAMDGEQALMLLKKMPVDIVFTDIRMPIMDGLRLMDEINKAYPDIVVVVVSGYQDFSYVSHAIRTRVVDYLLKPVPQEAMEQLLVRLKAAYALRRHERMTRRLSAQINRASPTLSSNADGDGADDENDALLGVCLFCAGALPLSEDVEMYPGVAVWTDVSLEQWALEASAGAEPFTWAFMGNTPVERIVIYRSDNSEPERLARGMYTRLNEAAKAPVSCVCLKEPVALAQIGGVLRRLRAWLRHTIRIGQPVFLAVLPGDAVPAAPAPIGDRDMASQIADLLCGESAGRKDGSRVFERAAAEGWTQEQVHRLLMEAVSLIEAGRLNREEAAQYREVLTDLVCSALSIKELVSGVLSLQPAGDRSSTALTERQTILRNIEQYLHDNYHLHVNNQTLASAFGYVPSYISMLFRQAYGVSPGEYLTQIRLKQAKRLIYGHPDMLIREVAERVGFKNQHHFSRTFKKKVGVWPTHYVTERSESTE
ncbi:MAG: response regulator [Clostridia bacterium]|nr:response regulator [Clostridia bacterium]